MLHDLIIVGAGPVGATLALSLREADLDVVVLDARPPGTPSKSDRSLALSHGARLIFERLGVWSHLAATGPAVTPITSVDISQAGGFGMTRLTASEQYLPALGYVVSYRALQASLDAALARANIAVRFGAAAKEVGGTATYAAVTLQDAAAESLTARLCVVADGSGAVVAGVHRERRDYGQVALTARIGLAHSHQGRAFERFTGAGPMALLPEGDHYGLVWTMTPARAECILALSDDEFLRSLAMHFGSCVTGLVDVAHRRTFPLALEVARPIVGARVAMIGNAAQALHPVAGQGFNLGLRDAHELAQAVIDSQRDAIGTRPMLAAYARGRAPDRLAGIAFTHGLVQLFGTDASFVRWPRGLALTLLDAMPAAKRAFTRAMLFGVR